MKLIKNESDLAQLLELRTDAFYWVDDERGKIPPTFPFLASRVYIDESTSDVLCVTVDHAEELIKVARRMMPVLE